jgi:hypothetical protein
MAKQCDLGELLDVVTCVVAFVFIVLCAYPFIIMFPAYVPLNSFLREMMNETLVRVSDYT